MFKMKKKGRTMHPNSFVEETIMKCECSICNRISIRTNRSKRMIEDVYE